MTEIENAEATEVQEQTEETKPNTEPAEGEKALSGFDKAFQDAQAALAPKEEKKEAPAPKEKKEPEAKAGADEAAKDKTEEKPEEKPAEGEKKEPEDKAKDEAKEEKKGPLEPKKYWSTRKKDAFKYLPRQTQEAWLEEAPAPDQRWTAEQKEAFSKIQRDGQELILERAQEMERGYGEKFRKLADDSKLAEEIRNAIPDEYKEYFNSRNITPAKAFSQLIALQKMASDDPVAYAKKFITDYRLNPADIFAVDQEGKVIIKPSRTEPLADITSHPEYRALKQRLQQSEAQLQAALEAENARRAGEVESLIGDIGEDGNPRFPFIRLVGEHMARIIESESDRFDGLSPRDTLQIAYNLALEDFPELKALQAAAPKPRIDESKATQADLLERARAEKLAGAVTPKSHTPATAPAASNSLNALDAAIAKAAAQLRS